MIYEQLNLEDTYWVCVTVAKVSWRTKEQENTQRPRKGLATTGYLVLRDPAVITGIRRKGGHPRARGNSACASPMCAHERGIGHSG